VKDFLNVVRPIRGWLRLIAGSSGQANEDERQKNFGDAVTQVFRQPKNPASLSAAVEVDGHEESPDEWDG